MGTSEKTYNRLGIDIGSKTIFYFPIISVILQIFRKHLPNF